MPLITLLTDFGTADGYVGELKGVLHSALPGILIEDIAHDLPAHDIEFARLTVARYWRRFPTGTVHVVVVDPGVGSSRAALAVESEGRFLVGPDNGVLSSALEMPSATAVVLPVPSAASPTFHGRDVFAPAAARLAAGVRLVELGGSLASPVVRQTPEPRRDGDGALIGEVIAIDRFGNAITNLPGRQPDGVSVGGQRLRWVRTYSDLKPGESGALQGSNGLVELVVRDGRAVDALALKRGEAVRVLGRASASG